MPDAEIEVIRQILSANPRPAELVERRQRLDALGGQYPLPTDVRLEAADANGVPGEWSMTPAADPANVILYLHGGGYTTGSLKSHRHMVAQAGREARARLSARARASFPGGGGRLRRRLSLPAVARFRSEPYRRRR